MTPTGYKLTPGSFGLLIFLTFVSDTVKPSEPRTNTSYNVYPLCSSADPREAALRLSTNETPPIIKNPTKLRDIRLPAKYRHILRKAVVLDA